MMVILMGANKVESCFEALLERSDKLRRNDINIREVLREGQKVLFFFMSGIL